MIGRLKAAGLAAAMMVMSGAPAGAAALPAPSAPVVQSLAPGGRLRAAINLGNPVLAQKDPATGEPGGVSVDLALELGRRLGVPVELVVYDAAGKVFAGLDDGQWDVAFLAIEPARAEKVAFTGPYVFIDGTYMVRATSAFRSVEDLDRKGVRISVGKGAAYDLYLSRTLKNAELVRAPTSAAAIDAFLADPRLDAAAGVRQALDVSAKGEARVMEGAFQRIEQAMGVPRGREAGTDYLRAFVEAMKASGFVRQALDRSGEAGATVAPAAR